MRELILEPWLREIDRRLRTAGDDFEVLQGHAQALERLTALLTVKPPRPTIRRPIEIGDVRHP